MTVRLPDGRLMVEPIVTALRAVCGDVVIAGGETPMLALRHVPDLRRGEGPMAGIEALLNSAIADEYIMCACDTPLMTSEVLRRLLDHRDAHATVARIAGRSELEPLPIRIASTALPIVRQLLDQGVRSTWRLVQDLPAAVVDVEAPCARAFSNINTVDDLNRL